MSKNYWTPVNLNLLTKAKHPVVYKNYFDNLINRQRTARIYAGLIQGKARENIIKNLNHR